MMLRSALLPLGQVRGDDALNVWEYVAVSEWLKVHERPGDARNEQITHYIFDREMTYWEKQTYYNQFEAATLYDVPGFEEEVDAFLYEDSDVDDYN